MYGEILNNFLVLSMENWFNDDEVIHLDDYAKGLKLFFKGAVDRSIVIRWLKKIFHLGYNKFDDQAKPYQLKPVDSEAVP